MTFEMSTNPDGKHQAKNLETQHYIDGEQIQQPNAPMGGGPIKRQFVVGADGIPAKRMNLGQEERGGFLPFENNGEAGQPQLGTVKSFNKNTGYGFIVSDRFNQDIVMFMKDVLCGEVKSGDQVQFILRYSFSGRPQASEVQLSAGGGCVMNVNDGGYINNPGVDMSQQHQQQHQHQFVTTPPPQNQSAYTPQNQSSYTPQNQSTYIPSAEETKGGQDADFQYPALTVNDLKLYADQLNVKDLGELAAHATSALQIRLANV